MIIEKIKRISEIQEFIEKNKEDEMILVHHSVIDVPLALKIIKMCEEVDDFLSIEIGRNYFYIIKSTCKCSTGCPYTLSTRDLNEIIKDAYEN